MSPSAYSEQAGHFITLPNGQVDHFYLDSFVSPWLPRSKKQVLLIQHGHARSGQFWYHWVPALSRDYIVIRRDLRGHGRASFPKRQNPWSEANGVYENYAYNVDTIIREIADFLTALEVDKVHFLGESTGGELALAFAALYPERARSLILCSAPTWLPPATCQFLAMGHESWPEAVARLGSRGWAEKLAAHSGTAPTTSPEYLEWWLCGVGANSAEGMAGYTDFLTHLNVGEFVSRVQCPALVLAPTGSKPVPLIESQKLASNLANSKLPPDPCSPFFPRRRSLTRMSTSTVVRPSYSNEVRYLGIFFAVMGAAGNQTTLLSFAQNNIVGSSKRLLVSALNIAGGAIGGIIGSTAFRSEDAPFYNRGINTVVALQVLLIALATGTLAAFWRINRRADQRGEEINLPGWRHTL
ncbi:hypothetical protein ACJZ2D_006411 [Fusarium nematophilum]